MHQNSVMKVVGLGQGCCFEFHSVTNCPFLLAHTATTPSAVRISQTSGRSGTARSCEYVCRANVAGEIASTLSSLLRCYVPHFAFVRTLSDQGVLGRVNAYAGLLSQVREQARTKRDMPRIVGSLSQQYPIPSSKAQMICSLCADMSESLFLDYCSFVQTICSQFRNLRAIFFILEAAANVLLEDCCTCCGSVEYNLIMIIRSTACVSRCTHSEGAMIVMTLIGATGASS